MLLSSGLSESGFDAGEPALDPGKRRLFVSEVSKGFRQRRFYDLSDRDKRDILKLMARVAEQAYRRGVQQGRRIGGQVVLPARLVGVALPPVARPVPLDRQSDDDCQPRPARCRMWRAAARAGVLQR